MSNLTQFPPIADNPQNKILGHWVGKPRQEGSKFHAVSPKYIFNSSGSTFRCPHAGCGQRLMASRVTRKQVDPIKALFLGVLGLAATAALVYLLIHAAAILIPLGVAAAIISHLQIGIGAVALLSLIVGLKNFVAFLSSIRPDPAIDEEINRNKRAVQTRLAESARIRAEHDDHYANWSRADEA